MYNPKSLKKILVFLSLIMITLFVGHYFLYRDIKLKNEHISILSAELESQSERQGYLIATERVIESIKEDIELIDKSIIASNEDVDFIEDLEAIARRNGLTIKIDSLVIEDAKELDAAGITTLKVRAKTTGPWVGTYTFLSEVESLPFKIKVNKFAILNTGEGASVEGATPVLKNEWQSTFEILILKYK